MSDSSLRLQLHRESFEISEAFLTKYNRPGPRYTSYPTAPVWQDDFGPDDLEKYYSFANAGQTPVSLYMHLPFCESLCLFCACNVVITKDHSVAPPYIQTLEREIDHVSQRISRERPVVQSTWTETCRACRKARFMRGTSVGRRARRSTTGFVWRHPARAMVQAARAIRKIFHRIKGLKICRP